ncbi:serine hydrolase domain-containing protein [Flavihumibacter solisilvae]|uniref:serine hydrolase domain-containing protein n=1 Tax=Flavihumibacter solisilvae TaxID=1349421 RepID=UPI0009E3D50E|nr:serine hydrolase domain-containing protein [Flavihumibacter solisilvae]
MNKVFSVFVLLLASFTAFGQSPAATAKVDTAIERIMKESGMVGLGAAIIVDKKLAWSKGYGYADLATKKPFTPTTIMNIGSISKTFTGACMMRAAEDKKLSLDEDINTYLPFKVTNPNFPDAKITLRNLATHTSGIADRDPFYSDSTYHYGGDSPEQLGDFLRNYLVPGGKHYSTSNFLEKKPGSYREYSNIAAGLAGYIVELRTGRKLNDYCRQTIFKPLEMNNSGWFLSEVNLGNHTKLYNKTGDSIRIIPFYSLTTYPDGGVRTSVDELSHFFISLLNNGTYSGTRILKKESVDEMLRFQFTASNKPENVNLDKQNSGIFWSTKLNASRIGHGGSDPGIKTEMLSDLSKEIGVIIFTNTDLKESDLKKFFDIYEVLYKQGQAIKNGY